ncbi:uncharacterized protein [Miscanthus floridulus]|uniref:uncharacterized protein isoform X2 n=1 Tax=Miscanthus floridulus TaxID=154761 RepID=UPI003459957D
MLQWTGGSRRKVYASRKSTQSRQRQYFEQKRRQQQRPELQYQDGVAGGQASHGQQYRSLDVLNINDLATPDNHHNGSTNIEGAIPQVDCTLSDASAKEAMKITSLCNINMTEAGSQPRLSSPFGHQDVAAAVNYHEDPLGCKMSPSINYSTRQKNQNLELQSEISLIDLVSYEGSKNTSTARPVHEPHVSFSVKGLQVTSQLKFKFWPWSYQDGNTSTFTATSQKDSITSIKMLKERRPSAKMGSILEETGYERREQFNCYLPDSSKSHNADLYVEDEDMFYEPQAEKDWQCFQQQVSKEMEFGTGIWTSGHGRKEKKTTPTTKHSRSDGNLADENYDGLWRIDQFNSEDHLPTQREKHFDISGYGFKDGYSPERRNSTRSSTVFENTGILSSHDLFSDHSLMDDEGTDLFKWERHPPSKKISNSNSTFGPSAWSFDMADDSEKRRSPISEESCTSAAAMKDRTCKKPSPSMKNEMNENDEFHIRFDKLDIPNMDAPLHGRSLFNSPEKLDRKETAPQNKLETNYWSQGVTGQPRTREPSCRLSLNEKFSDWDSPTSHLKSTTGLTDQSSCTMMRKDKSSFNAAPDLNMYQTVESTEKRPASKVHSIYHGPEKPIFEDEIHMQQPVSDMFHDKIELSNPFQTKNLHSDIDMSTFFGQKVEKNQEDKFPSVDTFHAVKAANSVRQAVDRDSTSSQPSGRDSFRHRFSPGFKFQESEPNTFWADSYVCNGTFQAGLAFSGVLARNDSDKNEVKIEASEKPDTKILTETCRLSADHRNEINGTETCSGGSEAFNCSEAQKKTSAAATQIPANLSCLQGTSAELFQVRNHVIPVKREKIDNPGVSFDATMHSRNKIHDVGDHSKLNAMFQSPFIGEEMGIEKKIVASVSPDNSDVQYQFMLEQRVLQRLCVQKIVVPEPMKDKLDKDAKFRIVEDGSHVLAKSV